MLVIHTITTIRRKGLATNVFGSWKVASKSFTHCSKSPCLCRISTATNALFHSGDDVGRGYAGGVVQAEELQAEEFERVNLIQPVVIPLPPLVQEPPEPPVIPEIEEPDEPDEPAQEVQREGPLVLRIPRLPPVVPVPPLPVQPARRQPGRRQPARRQPGKQPFHYTHFNKL